MSRKHRGRWDCRGARVAVALAAGLVVAATNAQASHFDVSASPGTVQPGQAAAVVFSQSASAAELAASVSFTVSYDATRFSPPSSCVVVGAAAASKSVSSNASMPGHLLLGVLGFNKTTIPSGPVVICQFPVRTGAPPGVARFSATAAAASAAGTSIPTVGGYASVTVGGDADGDGIVDVADNCPYVSNSGQEDRGGVGAGSPPDGIGDACQCGDVNGDGSVTLVDIVMIRRALLNPPTMTITRPELCDVGGSSGCNVSDAVVIQRALLNPPTATIAPSCAPAHP